MMYSDDGQNGVKPERLNIQLAANRRPSEATEPVDYHMNRIVSPTESKFNTTGGFAQDTPVQRGGGGANSGIFHNNSEANINDTDTIPEGLSAMSFPIPNHAVLPNGISPRALLADDVSSFT